MCSLLQHGAEGGNLGAGALYSAVVCIVGELDICRQEQDLGHVDVEQEEGQNPPPCGPACAFVDILIGVLELNISFSAS